jgi:hypothetical protein
LLLALSSATDRNGNSTGVATVERPRGQKSRKTKTSKDGKIKEGFCIKEKLGLEGEDNKDTYLELRASEASKISANLTDMTGIHS